MQTSPSQVETDNIYLIAHNVRGQASFDIAEKTTSGFIVCTGGYLAHPYWHIPISALGLQIPPMPEGSRDVFAGEKMKLPELDLASLLKIAPKAQVVKRRV